MVACPDFRFLLCAKTRQINQGRGMALRVFNYSQVVFTSPWTHSDSLKVRLTILMFVFEWLLVTLRCQIWSSFWASLVSAACRLRESDSSSLYIIAIMQS
jgi:hypothetical protein